DGSVASSRPASEPTSNATFSSSLRARSIAQSSLSLGALRDEEDEARPNKSDNGPLCRTRRLWVDRGPQSAGGSGYSRISGFTPSSIRSHSSPDNFSVFESEASVALSTSTSTTRL